MTSVTVSKTTHFNAGLNVLGKIIISKKELKAMGIPTDAKTLTGVSLRDPSGHITASFAGKTLFGNRIFELTYDDKKDADSASSGRGFLASKETTTKFSLEVIDVTSKAAYSGGNVELTIHKPKSRPETKPATAGKAKKSKSKPAHGSAATAPLPLPTEPSGLPDSSIKVIAADKYTASIEFGDKIKLVYPAPDGLVEPVIVFLDTTKISPRLLVSSPIVGSYNRADNTFILQIDTGSMMKRAELEKILLQDGLIALNFDVAYKAAGSTTLLESPKTITITGISLSDDTADVDPGEPVFVSDRETEAAAPQYIPASNIVATMPPRVTNGQEITIELALESAPGQEPAQFYDVPLPFVDLDGQIGFIGGSGYYDKDSGNVIKDQWNYKFYFMDPQAFGIDDSDLPSLTQIRNTRDLNIKRELKEQRQRVLSERLAEAVSEDKIKVELHDGKLLLTFTPNYSENRFRGTSSGSTLQFVRRDINYFYQSDDPSHTDMPPGTIPLDVYKPE